MAYLIEEIFVGATTLRIKFLKTPKVSTISKNNFVLEENAATPITTPFKDIDIDLDYNSIARIITLHYTNPLKNTTSYRITVTGLLSATGALFADDYGDFITLTTPELTVEELVESSEELPVAIVDKSIKSAIFFDSETILAENPVFHIVGTDPKIDEPIVTEDYQNGRVTIKFNAYPANAFITSEFFVAQRKSMSRGFSRWETLSAQVSVSNTNPWVYIDFPSTDATPVYHVDNAIYFESSYKYRVRIFENVGI